MRAQPKSIPPATSLVILDEAGEETLHDFEKSAAELAHACYLFRLFVSGTSPRSALAITNVRAICENHLMGRYELEVIDVFQQLERTKEAQIIAVPTLIKELPFPPQRFVGDMSNREKILTGLKLKCAKGPE